MTTLYVIIAAGLAAATVFMFVYSLSSRIAAELSPPDEKARVRAEESQRPYFWMILVRKAGILVPAKLGEDLRQKITMAGGLQGMTPAEVMLYVLLSLSVAIGAGILIITMTEWSPWWVLLMCTSAVLMPFVWLRDQVKKRHLEILRDMPFHLDILTLSVEAGLDFGAAVARMVDKGKQGALREEFSSFLGEIRMGKTRAESMESMSSRVGLPALSTFLGSLIQADKLGSGLGKTLRVQSEQLRGERFQRAEKAAGEAPVKMLLPLLFIFVTVWIILASPLVFEWLFKGKP